MDLDPFNLFLMCYCVQLGSILLRNVFSITDHNVSLARVVILTVCPPEFAQRHMNLMYAFCVPENFSVFHILMDMRSTYGSNSVIRIVKRSFVQVTKEKYILKKLSSL